MHMNDVILTALSLPLLQASETSLPDSNVPVERPAGEIGDLSVDIVDVRLEDGRTVQVESGSLLVPERRAAPDSAAVALPFYRIPSTAEAPAPPVFLLAGGPGSSWLEQFENVDHHADVMRLAEACDVVLFDQRGAGRARPRLDPIGEPRRLPADEPFDVDRWGEEMREMSAACRDYWTARGVDLDGYTTAESAADVDALREALGYERISLLGGSYGSHLALAVMKRHPQRLHRVVLHGVEGLDHTWDDPAGRLRALERIAADVESSERYRGSIPEGGLLAALRSAIEELEREPVVARTRRGVDVVVDAQLLRMVAGFQAGRKSRPDVWPRMILEAAEGDWSTVAEGALALRRMRLDRPMHYMMDCASGISPARRARYASDPARALLGDVNMEYEHVCPAWDAPDLGDAFRAAPRCDVPTLVIHGTWDTKTPIENAGEVVEALPDATFVEVIRGGHGALYDLYRQWPEGRAAVLRFLAGEDVAFPPSVELPSPYLDEAR
ncbi:MAG: alpha/beta fold hydrolase [Planctomycetota bacterium]